MNGLECSSTDPGLSQKRGDSPLYSKVRLASLFLSNTPLHPQWFSFRAKEQARKSAVSFASGLFLDIGCGGGELRDRVAGSCSRYVGLDYPVTGHALYNARPDVFADASRLPFASSTFDCVALFDVLEHLRHPGEALIEIERVLKPGGVLLINVPYLYPLHDEPHDYQRFTLHGLKHRLAVAGLTVLEARPRGAPTETAALLINIALARLVVSLVRKFPPGLLLGALLIPVVAVVNVLGWAVGRLSSADDAMPFAYWVAAKKMAHSASE